MPQLNSFWLPSHGRASFARPGPIPGRGNCHYGRGEGKATKADLTSSQPTKDDHRGNQTEQNGNRDATELACGCGVFPRRAAARDAPAVWCFLPPGRVEEVAIARP